MKKAVATLAVALVLSSATILAGCGSSESSDNQSENQQQESSGSAALTESDKDYFVIDDYTKQVPFEGSLAGVLYIPPNSSVPYGSAYNGDSLSAGDASIEVGWNVSSQYTSESADWKNASIFYTTLFYKDSNATEPLFSYTGYDSASFSGSGSAMFSIIDSMFGIQAQQFGEPKYAKTWISSAYVTTKNGNNLTFGISEGLAGDMDKLVEHDWDGFIAALDEWGYYCGGKALTQMG